MAGHKDTSTATRQVIPLAGGGKPKRKKAAAKPAIAKDKAIPTSSAPPVPLVPGTPTEDQLFYLRMLARHLCSRKGIKTLTLADSAGIAGDQKQKENKTRGLSQSVYPPRLRAHGLPRLLEGRAQAVSGP